MNLASFKQELNVSLEMKDLVICLEVHRKHFFHTAMDLKGNETMCDLFLYSVPPTLGCKLVHWMCEAIESFVIELK